VIRDRTAKVDRRNIATILIPGILTMETLFAAAGQGAPQGNLAGAREYRNCQFMTPETGRTTHFFWSYLNNFQAEDDNISRSLLDSLIEGFMEDKAIIERQQRTLEEDPGFQMLAILADAPLAHFRHVLEKLIAAEQGGSAPRPASSASSVG
jgi:vanillate O-demethylase monooxygenase subunit